MPEIKTEKKIKFFNVNFFNFKIINKIIFFVIVIFSVYYLASINDLTVNGFKQEKLREKNRQLVKENENMELATMLLGSYGNINSRIKNLKMVVAGNIDYIETGATIVARR
ncbi:MAG: hypothetical protein AAB653_02225 [Patescibacteria group bacterium]